jgi:hypothetical protein
MKTPRRLRGGRIGLTKNRGLESNKSFAAEVEVSLLNSTRTFFAWLLIYREFIVNYSTRIQIGVGLVLR